MAKFEKNIYKNLNQVVDEKDMYCVMCSTLSYNVTKPTLIGVYKKREEAEIVAARLNVGAKTCTYWVKEAKPSQMGFGPYSPIAANFGR